MSSMANLLDDQLECEAEQLDELYEEFEPENPFSEFEEEDEWLDEINRKSRDYTRWVQNSLNKILGLKLKIDGIMGTQTKSAIRSFQQRNRLSADGVVGARTESAIKAALAGKITSIMPTSPPQIFPRIPPNTTVPAPEKIDKFDKDSSQLKKQHYTAIDRIANRIALSWKSGIPISTVWVKGHASSEGKPQHNMGLGQRRALAVRRQLIKALENQQKNLSYKVLILAQSKGGTNPTASNNTENGRMLNRRIEVLLSTKVLQPIKPLPPPPNPPTDQKPPKTCRFPRCDPSVPTTVWAACGKNKYGVSYECVPVLGEKCGICEGASKKAEKCLEENERRQWTARQKCRDEYNPWSVFSYILAKCGPNAAKCVFKSDPMACLKTARCFLDPEPLNRYQACLKKESKRYIEEGQRCRRLP